MVPKLSGPEKKLIADAVANSDANFRPVVKVFDWTDANGTTHAYMHLAAAGTGCNAKMNWKRLVTKALGKQPQHKVSINLSEEGLAIQASRLQDAPQKRAGQSSRRGESAQEMQRADGARPSPTPSHPGLPHMPVPSAKSEVARGPSSGDLEAGSPASSGEGDSIQESKRRVSVAVREDLEQSEFDARTTELRIKALTCLQDAKIPAWAPDLNKIAAQGSNATVHWGFHPDFRKDVAVKVSKFHRGQVSLGLLQELEFLLAVRGERVFVQLVDIIAVGQSPISVGLVLDKATLSLSQIYKQDNVHKRGLSSASSGGSQPEGGVSLGTVAILAEQMTKALEFLYSRQFVHTDVKPANILVIENSGDPDTRQSRMANPLQFQLADLNSMFLDKPSCRRCPGRSEIEEHGCAKVGTFVYRAPELWFGSITYDGKVDMWSLGVILAELAASQYLFYGREDFDQPKIARKVLREECDTQKCLDDLKSLPFGCEEPWLEHEPRLVPPFVETFLGADGIAILNKMLLPSPSLRCTPVELRDLILDWEESFLDGRDATTVWIEEADSGKAPPSSGEAHACLRNVARKKVGQPGTVTAPLGTPGISPLPEGHSQIPATPVGRVHPSSGDATLAEAAPTEPDESEFAQADEHESPRAARAKFPLAIENLSLSDDPQMCDEMRELRTTNRPAPRPLDGSVGDLTPRIFPTTEDSFVNRWQGDKGSLIFLQGCLGDAVHRWWLEDPIFIDHKVRDDFLPLSWESLHARFNSKSEAPADEETGKESKTRSMVKMQIAGRADLSTRKSINGFDHKELHKCTKAVVWSAVFKENTKHLWEQLDREVAAQMGTLRGPALGENGKQVLAAKAMQYVNNQCITQLSKDEEHKESWHHDGGAACVLLVVTTHGERVLRLWNHSSYGQGRSTAIRIGPGDVYVTTACGTPHQVEHGPPGSSSGALWQTPLGSVKVSFAFRTDLWSNMPWTNGLPKPVTAWRAYEAALLKVLGTGSWHLPTLFQLREKERSIGLEGLEESWWSTLEANLQPKKGAKSRTAPKEQETPMRQMKPNRKQSKKKGQPKSEGKPKKR